MQTYKEFFGSEGKAWWIIQIANYGVFAFYGTSHEAEERRRDKSRWEGEIGWKRLAGDSDYDKDLIKKAEK